MHRTTVRSTDPGKRGLVFSCIDFLDGINRGKQPFHLAAEIFGLAHHIVPAGHECRMEHPCELVFLFLGKVNGHIPAADHIEEPGDRLAAHKIVGTEPDQILEMGFYLAFGGYIGYPKSQMAEVIKIVPQDRLVVETDCPYLPPQKYRGQRNEPAYIKLTVEKMAEIRGTNIETMAKITSENAERLFKLK